MVTASPLIGRVEHGTPHHDRVAPTSPFTRGSIAYGSMPNMPSSKPSTPLSLQRRTGDEMPSNTIINPVINPVNQTNQGLILQNQESDEEHELVQDYIRRLSDNDSSAAVTTTPRLNRSSLSNHASFINGFSDDAQIREKQNRILHLEARNRKLMKEIERIKKGEVPLEQLYSSNREPSSLSCSATTSSQAMEPMYASELTALRSRKDELEKQLTTLHDSRKELLLQLESLMSLLKSHGTLLTSPSSTPSSGTSTLTRSGQQTSSLNRTSSSFRRERETSTGEVRKAMTRLARELNSEDEEAIDQLGLNLSKNLAMRRAKPSGHGIPPSTISAQIQVHSSPKKASGIPRLQSVKNYNRQARGDDFDEEELVSIFTVI